MNTLMASVKTGSASRGQYASSGEAGERELYISAAPAGSAQDNLRDFNRVAYRSERPWNDSPRPAFADGDVIAAPVAPAPGKVRRRKVGFFERATAYARRDRKGVVACVVLCCAIVMLTALWGGRMVDGVQLARDIASYQSQTRALLQENETLVRQLEAASSGERIRNLAQNELGMLRRERANQEIIYIRNDNDQTAAAQPVEEPRMELLDVLLGLLDVFHIGE